MRRRSERQPGEVPGIPAPVCTDGPPPPPPRPDAQTDRIVRLYQDVMAERAEDAARRALADELRVREVEALERIADALGRMAET